MSTPPRVIAIGDIHGCARALDALLDAISPQPLDQIVTLGDVVDRGPESRLVVDRLLSLQEQCVLTPVLGNHEEMMLDVVARGAPPEPWLTVGGSATLESYGYVGSLNVIPDAHVRFLSSHHDWVETESHFFVHANYEARVPLGKQRRTMLRWRGLDDHLPGPHASGKVAVVGHTPDLSGEVMSLRHLRCIDTYCYGGRWLTALEVRTGQVWQANQRGELRKL